MSRKRGGIEQMNVNKFEKLTNRSKKFFLLGTIIILLCMFSLTGCRGEKKKKDSDNYLQTLFMESITVRESENDKVDASATKLLIEMPDLSEVFCYAKEHTKANESLEKEVIIAIEKKKCDIKSVEIVVEISEENNDLKELKEEAIKELLEKELVNAINTVMDGE